MKDLLQSIASMSRRVHNLFSVQKGRVEEASHRTRAGVGVRALVDGAWGFASTSTPERAAIRNAVEQAIESARALARAGARKVEPLPATELASADHVGEGYEELLALSIGDKLVRPEVSVRAFAEKDGSQVVCANAVGVTGGWQCLFHHPNAVAITERTAARAVELLDAPHVQGGVKTVILAPSIVGLLTHEAIGHTVEADLVLAGSVANGKIGERVSGRMVRARPRPCASSPRCPRPPRAHR